MKRSADSYNIQNGRWSNRYRLWQRSKVGKGTVVLWQKRATYEQTGIYGKLHLVLQVLQNVHVVKSWRAPMTYDITYRLSISWHREPAVPVGGLAPTRPITRYRENFHMFSLYKNFSRSKIPKLQYIPTHTYIHVRTYNEDFCGT